MKVFVYVVAASKNPDAVECVVPYRVNDDMIFLGPPSRRIYAGAYAQPFGTLLPTVATSYIPQNVRRHNRGDASNGEIFMRCS